MPRPIVSRIANANHEREREHVNPKVVTLNIVWSRAIDGHWHASFFGFEQLNSAWC